MEKRFSFDLFLQYSRLMGLYIKDCSLAILWVSTFGLILYDPIELCHPSTFQKHFSCNLIAFECVLSQNSDPCNVFVICKSHSWIHANCWSAHRSQVLFDAFSSLVFCSCFFYAFCPGMSRGFKQNPLWKKSSWPLTWAFWRCGSGCEAKSCLWRCLSVSGLIQTTPRRHTLTGSPRSYSGPFTPRGTSCIGWSGL